MRALAYLVGGCVLLAAYAVSATTSVQSGEYPRNGALSRDRPALTAPLPGAISLEDVLDLCFPERAEGARTKVVGAVLDGEPFYACYALDFDHGGSITADVLDGRGRRVGDADLIKRAGAWPWIGPVVTTGDFVFFGGFACVILALFLLWHLLQRPRPGGARRGRLRTTRLVLIGILLGVSGITVFGLMSPVLLHPDWWGIAVLSFLLASLVYGPLAGRTLVAGRELVPDPHFGSRARDLAPALAGCLALAPVSVVTLVVLSAFGELPVTSTSLAGFAVFGVGLSALAGACVVFQWNAQRHESRAARPLLVRGAGWGAAVALGAALFALTLGATTDRIPGWVPTFEGDVATASESTADPSPPPGGQNRPRPEELRAARVIREASGRRVRRAYCSSGVCDVVFASGTCEVWLIVATEPARIPPALTCDESDVPSP